MESDRDGWVGGYVQPEEANKAFMENKDLFNVAGSSGCNKNNMDQCAYSDVAVSIEQLFIKGQRRFQTKNDDSSVT